MIREESGVQVFFACIFPLHLQDETAHHNSTKYKTDYFATISTASKHTQKKNRGFMLHKSRKMGNKGEKTLCVLQNSLTGFKRKVTNISGRNWLVESDKEEIEKEAEKVVVVALTDPFLASKAARPKAR